MRDLDFRSLHQGYAAWRGRVFGTGLGHGNWSGEDRRSLRLAAGRAGAVEIEGRV